jgi:hypothetical protein
MNIPECGPCDRRQAQIAGHELAFAEFNIRKIRIGKVAGIESAALIFCIWKWVYPRIKPIVGLFLDVILFGAVLRHELFIFRCLFPLNSQYSQPVLANKMVVSIAYFRTD